jgi:hypothetical protein
MRPTLEYSELRARLRLSLNHRETLLGWFRMLRYALIQGPWRAALVRRYETHDRNPRLLSFPATLFDGIDATEAAERLEQDACTARFQVPDDLVDRIVAWTRNVGAKRIDDAHSDCAPVQRVALDPAVIAVARAFLRAEPILFSSKIYWTKPPAGDDVQGRLNAAAEGGRFHYDLSDLKSVTLFVYLSEVDSESGPHVVIRGTQRRTTLPQILRRTISDGHAYGTYGDRIEVITGARGTSWFEDITCYHKQAAGTKVRLMLSITYTLHRRPLTDDARRPAASSDSRLADRMRVAV